uniref:Amino acid transporter transmembrane domain-containing protein n=1 Tax=Echeneis naucrates TaxID=173247 RepID=A0A665WGC5_ECHNA
GRRNTRVHQIQRPTGQSELVVTLTPEGRGASFAFSVFNLMNAIMGSGILGLSYAMACTGIVGFIILLILVSSLATYSIHLLLKLCDKTGINSYEDLGGRALRNPGKFRVNACFSVCLFDLENTHLLNFFSPFFPAMASYLFILKSELPAAIRSFISSDSTGNAWYDNGRLLLILITLCVVLPLSILPKIGFLGYTSSFAFFFMLYFAVVVVVKKWSIPCPLPHNVTSLSGTFQCTPKLFVISSESAYAIPTMAFSFLCHTTVLPIYCELDRPSKAKMQNVVTVSISLSFLLYLISALFGYLTFYAHVNSELLLSYDVYISGDIMVMTVRLFVLLAVLLTVPLIHFPARKAVIMLLSGQRPFSWLTHIIATLTILGVVLILAVFVPDIRNVFGVVGSTTSSCLLFVFPGIFYLRISSEPLRSPDSIGAVLLMVFGIIMGLISFSIIVITWVQSS